MRDVTRDAVVVEVRSRVLDACLAQARTSEGMPLDVLVNDTLYHEKKRLETDKGSPAWASDLAFWDGVKSRLGRAGSSELSSLLEAIIERFVHEVLGHFEPWVYNVSTSVIPRVLPILLNAMSPRRLLGASFPDLGESIRLEGRIDALRRCREMGTVILAPTHVSNLDSVVLGWALYAMGMPPFTYGAGLNLFSNPVLSFFIRNLGAYRVDRRKTAPLYKDVLKEYATVTIEKGQHQLFFPGGTRARSGQVEEKLKLGLLSSGLRAYINNLANRRPKPNVFIVPCTLNFHLVLEAESLIEDHLKLVGKSRYIITDDESSRPGAVFRFLRDLIHLDSNITVAIGNPIDPFGNQVDAEGQSRDGRGRPVDIRRYVSDGDDHAVHRPQRDRAYTRETGLVLAESFRRGNTVLATNLVAFALFESLRLRHPGLDLYRLLRSAGGGTGVTMGSLGDGVRAVSAAARELADEDQIRVSEEVAHGDPSALIASALRHFGTYHGHPVMVRRGDRVFAEDMNLLYYYRNRLEGYGFEQVMDSVNEVRSATP